MTQKVEFIVSAVDQASSVLKNVDQNAKEMSGSVGQSFDQLVAPSAAFLGVLTALGASMVALGHSALTQAASLEQTKIAFTTMTGSAENANALIQEMTNFAKKTPFTLQGLENETKKLLAYGISQKEVMADLKVLGDIAAGVGMDKLPNLTLAYGQVRAAGRLTGMELRQFTEAGVPLLEELSKVTGMAVQDMAGNIGNLHIPFETVQKALSNLSGEGGRFANLMEKQSSTFNGMMSNLEDAWTLFLRNAGQPLLEVGKKIVAWLLDLVTNVLPQVIDAMKNWADIVKNNQALLLGIAAAITAALVPALYAAAVAMLPFVIASAELIAISAAIGAAVYLLAEAWTTNFLHIQDITFAVFNAIKAVVNEFMPIFKGIWDMISGYFQVTFGSIIGIFKAFFQLLSGDSAGAWETIKQVYVNAWNGIITFFGGLQGIIGGIFSLLWDAIKFGAQLAWEGIIEVLKLAVEGLTLVITGWISLVTGVFKAFWQLLTGDWKGALNTLSGIWGLTWDQIKKFGVETLTSIGVFITEKILELVNWFTNDGKMTFTEGFHAMIGGIANVAKTVFNGVIGTIESFINWTINALNELINASNRVNRLFQIPTISPVALPRFAHGGMVDGFSGVVEGQGGIDKVPAMLSAGEVVLNAAQQGNLAGNLSRGNAPTIIVEINGNSFYGDDETFAQKIGRSVIDELKLHTGLKSF